LNEVEGAAVYVKVAVPVWDDTVADAVYVPLTQADDPPAAKLSE
jgi:hypothetical protein